MGTDSAFRNFNLDKKTEQLSKNKNKMPKRKNCTCAKRKKHVHRTSPNKKDGFESRAPMPSTETTAVSCRRWPCSSKRVSWRRCTIDPLGRIAAPPCVACFPDSKRFHDWDGTRVDQTTKRPTNVRGQRVKSVHLSLVKIFHKTEFRSEHGNVGSSRSATRTECQRRLFTGKLHRPKSSSQHNRQRLGLFGVRVEKHSQRSSQPSL